MCRIYIYKKKTRLRRHTHPFLQIARLPERRLQEDGGELRRDESAECAFIVTAPETPTQAHAGLLRRRYAAWPPLVTAHAPLTWGVPNERVSGTEGVFFIHLVGLLPPTRSLMAVWSHSTLVWRLRRHNRSENLSISNRWSRTRRQSPRRRRSRTLTFAGNSHWNCWHLAGAGSGHRGLNAIYLRCEPGPPTPTHTHCVITSTESRKRRLNFFYFLFFFQGYRKAIPTCVAAPQFCLW